MINRFIGGTPFLAASAWATVCLLVMTSMAIAQDIQLSAEQQQMLNQLPAAQRQQAMDALRQLQGNRDGSALQPLRESSDGELSDEMILPQDSDTSKLELTRAKVGSRLIVEFTLKEDLTKKELRDLQEDPVATNLAGSHAFVLDDTGSLIFQGLGVVPLLGLTEPDIGRRLSAESYLDPFDIDVRILSTIPTGVEALQPFGYEIFEPRDGSFDPSTTGPVPPDYVLGPGDTVRIQLFGNVNSLSEHDVTRDGILNLPEIGPVTVSGIPFSEFRQDVNERVREVLVGTQVSVTMGQLRTIRVFVLGDVNQPGSYVVSGLATISSALYRSGGISPIGSLRTIKLKRNGRSVANLDLYDLLVNGNSSGDRRLQPGDVIFVSPIGRTISIGGAVKRPAIYEIEGNASVSDALRLAGGLAADAFRQSASLERIDENGNRRILSIDLDNDSDNKMAVRAGDTLLVSKVLPDLSDAVMLSGHVQRPGPYQWRNGMRLADLIPAAKDLKRGVDAGYVLIRREDEPGQPIQVLSANLSEALRSRSSNHNLSLQSRDTVHVFALGMGRQRMVGPLLAELRLQSTVDNPAQQVDIAGNVRAPGPYPLESNMRVSDLIRAGGNLSEGAYAIQAELTRYSIDGDSREIELVNVDIDAIRKGVASADLVLQAHDYLVINRVPDWDSTWTVTLEGEVRFPGPYRVRRGETLSAVIVRAGGLTESAFVEGAVFLRDTLQEREQDQIELLARRLEADLASLSLETATGGGSDTLATGQVLLDQLRNTEPVGRLVIDISSDQGGGASAARIEMRDGDRLLVPGLTQVVTVLGETQQNTSHFYRENMSRDDYIDLSGGLTRRADKKLIYVVRANGAVLAGNRSKWFGRGGNVDIRPGDTIVVPLDTNRMRPLTFWTNVSQIVYQGAIAVAAVKTFNN